MYAHFLLQPHIVYYSYTRETEIESCNSYCLLLITLRE